MIFLSASVPQVGREYYGTENAFAIREAIIAFTEVCIEKEIPFFCGGHPAITPLVWQVVERKPLMNKSLIKIYQSKYFDTSIPPEASYFENIVFTEPKESKSESVQFMRQKMFSENKVDCAVFIGGMDGVIVEYNMLKEKYRDIKCWALASTGGAAADLYEKIGVRNEMLENNYSFKSIFRQLLKKRY